MKKTTYTEMMQQINANKAARESYNMLVGNPDRDISPQEAAKVVCRTFFRDDQTKRVIAAVEAQNRKKKGDVY